MPSQWNADADRDLLLAIIDEDKLKSIQWHNIAGRLTQKGYSFSHEACRQHFQKLRRESKNGRATSTGGGASSTDGTPRKPKKTSTPQSAKGTKGNGHANEAFEDDDESSHFDATPSKKRKLEKLEKFEDVDDVPAMQFKLEMDGYENMRNGSSYVDLDNDQYYED